MICGGGAPFEGDVDVIRAMARHMGIRFLDLDEAKNKARTLVRLHRPAIEVVASELLRRRIMTGEEIAAMLGTTVAPDLWDWAR